AAGVNVTGNPPILRRDFAGLPSGGIRAGDRCCVIALRLVALSAVAILVATTSGPARFAKYGKYIMYMLEMGLLDRQNAGVCSCVSRGASSYPPCLSCGPFGPVHSPQRRFACHHIVVRSR